MMKKIVGILLCLAVIGGGGTYLLLKKGSTGGQYARYLPQDAVGVVNLTHLNALTDAFGATALGRFVAKDAMHAMMQEMHVQQRAIGEYDATYDTIANIMTHPAFRAVFGEDTAIALLPPDSQLLNRDPAGALRSSLVVFATTPASGVLDLFGKLAASKTITRETIDGLELTKVVLEQNQTLYGYSEGKNLLLAYAPGAIKTCLATGKAGNGLEKSAPFKEAGAFWQPYPQEKIFTRSYCNVAKLAGLLKSAENPDIKQSGEWLQGVDSMVSLTYGTAQGLESRARSKYRYEQLHPLMKSAVDSVSPANPTLHFLQERSLAYNWASSLRPELLMKTFAAKEQEYRRVDAEVRKTLGVSMDELGRAIGPQYGGVLDDIIKTGLFPVPKMTLFFEIRDQKIAETAFKGLRRKIAEYGLTKEEQEVVNGTTIFSWPVLPTESTQPAMALTDSMFYLASSKQPLKEILASKAAPDKLAAPVTQQLGPELSDRLARANFGSCILFPQRMSRQTGEMISWLADILATTKNVSLARLNQEVVQLMQSTELIAMTSHLTKEQADWTMSLKAASSTAKPAK